MEALFGWIWLRNPVEGSMGSAGLFLAWAEGRAPVYKRLLAGALPIAGLGIIYHFLGCVLLTPSPGGTQLK